VATSLGQKRYNLSLNALRRSIYPH